MSNIVALVATDRCISTNVDKNINNSIQDNLLECPNGPGYYPHPKDCAYFYICKEHQSGSLEKFVFKCAPGTKYDTRYSVCTLEQFAHCEGEPVPVPTTKRPAKKVKTTTVPPTTTTEAPKEFHCSREGFYRNTVDCNIFVQCHRFPNGTYAEHSFNCPIDSFYNQEGNPPECVTPSPEQPLPAKCPPLKS